MFGVFGLFEAVGGQSDTTQWRANKKSKSRGVSPINRTRVGLYVWFEYELFVVDCIAGKA